MIQVFKSNIFNSIKTSANDLRIANICSYFMNSQQEFDFSVPLSVRCPYSVAFNKLTIKFVGDQVSISNRFPLVKV